MDTFLRKGTGKTKKKRGATGITVQKQSVGKRVHRLEEKKGGEGNHRVSVQPLAKHGSQQYLDRVKV